MKRMTLTNALLAISLAASAMTAQTSVAGATSPHLVPGMGMCMNPGGCAPKGPGGLAPNPPGGGGGGGFGSGLGAGIGLGVGLGIVNSLTRPRQPQVIYQQPQPVYVQPAPQPVATGLSAHDQYCMGKYKSYNLQTKHYLSYSGKYKPCISPYM